MAILRSLLLRHKSAAASLLRRRPLSVATISASCHFVSPQNPQTSSPPWIRNPVRRLSSASTERPSNPDGDEMTPCDPDIDEIEGCDFNHWLIVVDFPKDPRPNPEEMIRFYEETCSKALNISLDEAKKKIYATSTSNYTGFHVQVTEIESEKFQGQSGVVFVLPDSYADKEKKEYGGDKYINGIIIPRPRAAKGRRIWEEPRHDSRRSNQYEPQQQQQSHQSQDSQQSPPRASPPFTHQGLTQPNQPSNHYNYYAPAGPQAQQNQNYYYERRPVPNYPFQQAFARNPYQQAWAPHHHHHQGNGPYYQQGSPGWGPPHHQSEWAGSYAAPPPQVILVVLPHGHQGFGQGYLYPGQGYHYPGSGQQGGPGFSYGPPQDWYHHQQQQRPYSEAGGPGYYSGQPVQGPSPPGETRINNTGQQPENGQPEQGPPTGQWRGPSS